MSEYAIECEGLRKTYLLGQEFSLRRSIQMLLPARRAKLEQFRALDDVTFKVERGAYFGIVGANGSGKSTLTQIISGITAPDHGHARVWGRLLPLLEIGAGFHPDLTGRENVFLLGAIVGLSAQQIEASLPQIEEFAGVKRHLDTPLKRYSSGMQARLSFAAAIFFPADIYVFDEVLSVVDDAFRDQCLQAMTELSADGRTIVFMSHDLDLVTSACSTGMWLQHGRVRALGAMNDVADAYRNELVDRAIA
ncbi:MAG: type transport system ATP-binding protein [Solirubrobacteraceae bacterium]|jgi:ABC-type polysaccharide/polyol phosphate transport system ATPase subunit|nr:type transport system ATP-binding protein [Solirubrobacteraceae bacterium]